MKQAFEYNGLTIEVREETGLDLIDNPMLNRIVLDYVMGEADADLSKAPPLLWNRITHYVDQLQVSIVKGKGLTLPSVESTAEEIGKGFDVWLAYIADHPDCFRQWEDLRRKVNKQVADPQAESVEAS